MVVEVVAVGDLGSGAPAAIPLGGNTKPDDVPMAAWVWPVPNVPLFASERYKGALVPKDPRIAGTSSAAS